MDPITMHFDKVAGAYQTNYQGDNIVSHSFNTRLNIVLSLVGNAVGKSILDIGCGPGLLARGLAPIPCDFIGIDVSEKMVEECLREDALKGFRFQASGGLEFLQGHPTDKYHFIVCMGLFEYLTEAYAGDLMKQIAEHLHPEGSLIATYPNVYSPYRFADRINRKLTGKEAMVPPYTPGVGHKEFSELELRKEWKRYCIHPRGASYYNFRLIPKPLDEKLKAIDLFLSRRLQVLSVSALRFLATAMVLWGVKEC